MKINSILLSTTISILLVGTVVSNAQGLLGTLLNGLAHKPNSSQRADPFADERTDTYVMRFALNGESLIFESETLKRRENQRLDLCVYSLTHAMDGDMEFDLSNYAADGNPLMHGGVIEKQGTANDNTWTLYAASCGPVPIPANTPVDASMVPLFASVGVNTSFLKDDANAYVQGLKVQQLARAKQKAIQDANQSKLDVLYVATSAIYMPNGMMANISSNQYSPFVTAEECKSYVTKIIKTGISNGANLIGESVLVASDGSGSVWTGCVTVKALNSGAALNYLNVHMTTDKAKTIKLLPNIVPLDASPSKPAPNFKSILDPTATYGNQGR